jgi:hypothetical protein
MKEKKQTSTLTKSLSFLIFCLNIDTFLVLNQKTQMTKDFLVLCKISFLHFSASNGQDSIDQKGDQRRSIQRRRKREGSEGNRTELFLGKGCAHDFSTQLLTISSRKGYVNYQWCQFKGSTRCNFFVGQIFSLIFSTEERL